jgi:SAM-dependent methyltransferase
MQNDRTPSPMAQQGVGFYNQVAVHYNHMLEQDESNKMIREKVASRFVDSVKSGRVLDFGGGTGLDLDWLSRANYSILFCEPSNGMRRQARHHNNDNIHYDDIVFLDDTRVDFSKWNAELPFINPVDGILANFAVFNCIRDIELLLRSLSLVIKPGGHLWAIMLKKDYSKQLKSHFSRTISSMFSRSPLQFKVHFNEHQHTVYLHSIDSIKRASSQFFEWHNPEDIGSSNFSLIHLVKN